MSTYNHVQCFNLTKKLTAIGCMLLFMALHCSNAWLRYVVNAEVACSITICYLAAGQNGILLSIFFSPCSFLELLKLQEISGGHIYFGIERKFLKSLPEILFISWLLFGKVSILLLHFVYLIFVVVGFFRIDLIFLRNGDLFSIVVRRRNMKAFEVDNNSVHCCGH